MYMSVDIEPSWKSALTNEFVQPYFVSLTSFVRTAYTNTATHIYPPPKKIFEAFALCPLEKVKVVLLGQDPYHGYKQAHGLAFSVQDHIAIPPSLKNIYKEIHRDIGTPIPKSGNLTHWAQQGVLLLNTTLTVEAGKAGSHQGRGWEHFTDAVICAVSEKRSNVVFLLWGKYAQAKSSLIDTSKHLILTAPHPSPLSAHTGFFGCAHFSKTNAYLIETNQTPIRW